VLGQYKGVCKDELVGGQESNQLYTATRDSEITVITYRRFLISCKFWNVIIPTEYLILLCSLLERDTY
jgi:hypothetical protein